MEGMKKTLLAPKRKREIATWKAKPRRVARTFGITTPVQSISKETEVDIFDDLFRKHAQPLTAVAVMYRYGAGPEGVRPVKVTSEQPSSLERHGEGARASQGVHTAHSDDKLLPTLNGIEVSERQECVSMELTCSSSVKGAQDMTTPAIVHTLEVHTLPLITINNHEPISRREPLITLGSTEQ